MPFHSPNKINYFDIALGTLSVGLVYIDRSYMVHWSSIKAISSLFVGKEIYKPGEYCYKSVYNREIPCEDCPLMAMFNSHRKVVKLYKEQGLTMEITAYTIDDNDENIEGGILRIENITQKLAQETKIKELNRVMDAILNSIPVYLFVKSPSDNFRYLYWNKAMADNTKIPVSKVLGNTDYEVFPSKIDADKFRKDDLALLEGGRSLEFEEEFTAATGGTRIVYTTKTLIPSEDSLPWIMGLSWDITELKNTEKELQIAKENAEKSDRMKSTFLANMSHEIRTPLNAIVGFSDLLATSDNQEERTEYLDIIKKNNELLLQLISDILDLSKIEAQSLDFIYGKVDLHKLCNSIVTASNLKTTHQVEVRLGEHFTDCYIYSDANRVSQVIWNFVNNALKFTRSGFITIGYRLINESTLELYVEDTGTGIPPDCLDSVFERFVKLDAFTQGTGLGLSICKSIVNQLNGDIGVESTVGVGTRFWITHPYDKSYSPLQFSQITQQTTIKNSPIMSTQTNPTILVAEDIDSNYLLVETVLKRLYTVVRAYNGLEAVAYCKQHKPALILMDIKMPEMNGLEATQIIREIYPDLPIIALTAFAFDSDMEKAQEVGCTDFLSKPINIQLLKAKILEYI